MRLRELEEIAAEKVRIKQEPEGRRAKKNLASTSFTACCSPRVQPKVEGYVADCARRMVAHLFAHKLLPIGWSGNEERPHAR